MKHSCSAPICPFSRQVTLRLKWTEGMAFSNKSGIYRIATPEPHEYESAPSQRKRPAQSLSLGPCPKGLLLIANKRSLINVLRMPGPHHEVIHAKRSRCSYGDRAPSGTRRNANS